MPSEKVRRQHAKDDRDLAVQCAQRISDISRLECDWSERAEQILHVMEGIPARVFWFLDDNGNGAAHSVPRGWHSTLRKVRNHGTFGDRLLRGLVSNAKSAPHLGETLSN